MDVLPTTSLSEAGIRFKGQEFGRNVDVESGRNLIAAVVVIVALYTPSINTIFVRIESGLVQTNMPHT